MTRTKKARTKKARIGTAATREEVLATATDTDGDGVFAIARAHDRLTAASLARTAVYANEQRESFRRQVVGLAEAIVTVDCGATHGGNWRLPCRRCIEHEDALKKTLLQAIADENVRRMRRLLHDERDGNRARQEQGGYAG